MGYANYKHVTQGAELYGELVGLLELLELLELLGLLSCRS